MVQRGTDFVGQWIVLPALVTERRLADAGKHFFDRQDGGGEACGYIQAEEASVFDLVTEAFEAGEREDEEERREDVGARDERDHVLSPSGTC